MSADAKQGNAIDFVVERANLRHYKWVPAPEPDSVDLHPGQVLLQVAKFAFTANNVTYAVAGEMMTLLAEVEAHEHVAGVLEAHEHVLRAHAAERREVPHRAVLEVGREQMVALVSVGVVEVEDVARVRGPAIPVDGPVSLVRDGPRGVTRLHPHVLHALLVGSQPGDAAAVGRELRERPR